jgi:hypothetical protein
VNGFEIWDSGFSASGSRVTGDRWKVLWRFASKRRGR